MTNAFKKIHDDHQRDNIDALKMIGKLGNALLNLQQMSAQQAAHLVLALPLHSSSRKCTFIDTRSHNDRIFILKPTEQLKKEPDNSENVMSRSIIEYYLSRPQEMANLCLAEYVSSYKKDRNKLQPNAKPNIIRFINFSKHLQLENYCRE